MVHNLGEAIDLVKDTVTKGRILKPDNVLAMIDDVDYYLEYDSNFKCSKEAKDRAMDFAVQCASDYLKVDAAGEQSNQVIEDLRRMVWAADVDYPKLTKAMKFRGPVINYKYTDAVLDGCYTDSKVKGPKTNSGLCFEATPLIRSDMFNAFEREVMGLPLIKESIFVPEVWNKLAPELRRFILSGETVFPGVSSGSTLTVEDLEKAYVWQPAGISRVGHLLRFICIKMMLDVTSQWDSTECYPIIMAPKVPSVGSVDAQEKCSQVVTHSLYFMALRILTMYKAIFYRTLHTHYKSKNNYCMVNRLEGHVFDTIAQQAWKRYEADLFYVDITLREDKCFYKALTLAETRYCRIRDGGEEAYPTDGSGVSIPWEVKGNCEETLQQVHRTPKYDNGSSATKDKTGTASSSKWEGNWYGTGGSSSSWYDKGKSSSDWYGNWSGNDGSTSKANDGGQTTPQQPKVLVEQPKWDTPKPSAEGIATGPVVVKPKDPVVANPVDTKDDTPKEVASTDAKESQLVPSVSKDSQASPIVDEVKSVLLSDEFKAMFANSQRRSSKKKKSKKAKCSKDVSSSSSSDEE